MNCQGVKADGTLCAYNAQPGSTLCGVHKGGNNKVKRRNSREYVNNRTPSHCDRVLTSPEMNKLKYTNIVSTESGFVKYSDHDAVYALADINGLQILIATWNAGNINVDPNFDADAIKHDWAKILSDPVVDVVFFSLQEMARKDAKKFYKIIQNILPDFNWIIGHSTSGKILAADAYTVSGLLGHKKGNGVALTKTRSRCLEQTSGAKTILCTKSVISMSFTYMGNLYTMVGAHFPFKSKDTETWGNDQRIRAMREALQFVLNKSDPHYTVLTGDLNFRNVSEGDQLTILLDKSDKFPIPLVEGDHSFAPTCKLEAVKKPKKGTSTSLRPNQIGSGPEVSPENQGEDTASTLREENQQFFEKLLEKAKDYDAPLPGPGNTDSVNIPKSKYHRISSAMPVNPNQHSWYHHHAPFSQNFGEYVCVKRSALKDIGTFLKDSLLSDEK